MIGSECFAPNSFRRIRIMGLALAFGLALASGAVVGGHSQPAAEPAAAPVAAPAEPVVPPAATASPAGTVPAPAATPAPAESTSAPVSALGEQLRDLTPLGMFMQADIIVKAVMLGLVSASILTWTIWLAKSMELIAARRRLRRAESLLATAPSFDDIAEPASSASPHVALLIAAAGNELRRSPDLRDAAGIKERIAARFERIEAGVGRRMMRATGIVATIGAIAPFVGLFGTVWGIMNSFIGISKLHTTNLAVVAPGIAEALLATACGLAAAIPAVVIYNGFARAIAQYRGLFADACVDVLALVGRDLTPAPAPSADERRVRAMAPGGGVR